MTVNYKGHKIFAFSDTHGMYRKLEVPADADILICAGDACEGFNPADLQDCLIRLSVDADTLIPRGLRNSMPQTSLTRIAFLPNKCIMMQK